MKNSARPAVGSVDSATVILGNKWTPKLLRFFINEGSVRFCQIQDLVGGINPRTLCARLDDLEKAGVISKQQSTDCGRSVYALTEKGRDLVPVLQSMQQWSAKYPIPE